MQFEKINFFLIYWNEILVTNGNTFGHTLTITLRCWCYLHICTIPSTCVFCWLAVFPHNYVNILCCSVCVVLLITSANNHLPTQQFLTVGEWQPIGCSTNVRWSLEMVSWAALMQQKCTIWTVLTPPRYLSKKIKQSCMCY